MNDLQLRDDEIQQIAEGDPWAILLSAIIRLTVDGPRAKSANVREVDR